MINLKKTKEKKRQKISVNTLSTLGGDKGVQNARGNTTCAEGQALDAWLRENGKKKKKKKKSRGGWVKKVASKTTTRSRRKDVRKKKKKPR